MNPVISLPRIAVTNLNPYQYTLSLLNECLKTGALSIERGHQIQFELMELLSESIPKYTRHESNSVPTETAQGIMQSILYNIDHYLRSLNSPEQALETLSNSALSDCFLNGVGLTQTVFKHTKELWQEVQSNRLSVSMTAYNETIETGFNEFFYRYDANYSAHNADISIDYPLLYDDSNWTGVIYVNNYLQALKLENELCCHFPDDDLVWLLNCYAGKYNLSSSDLLTNIPDLVLRNSLAKILLGQPASMRINYQDCQSLYELLRGGSSAHILDLIQEALQSLLCKLNITDPDLYNYLKPYPEQVCPQLVSALKDNSLPGFLVLEPNLEPEQTVSIHYIPGEKLADEDLRLIIEALGYFPDVHSKVDFVLTRIHHIEDLIEILGAYRFYCEEFQILFDKLKDYELALLVKYSLEAKLEENEPAFSWQTQLKAYLEAKVRVLPIP